MSVLAKCSKIRCKTASLGRIIVFFFYQTFCSSIHSGDLHRSLLQLHTLASSTSAPATRVPPELIQYVDGGRNPDIYTREFVELARRTNQLMKGKKEAFASFRDILAREMASALPEVRADVEHVMKETGGDISILPSSNVWAGEQEAGVLCASRQSKA